MAAAAVVCTLADQALMQLAAELGGTSIPAGDFEPIVPGMGGDFTEWIDVYGGATAW